MRKVAVLTALALLTGVVSAQAAPKYVPAPPPKSHRCVPHSVGYYATGTLVSASLTSEGKSRFSGTLEVDLHRANHHAPTGDQTFTLSHARINFHHGVDPTAPAAGSRVKLHGKITALPKHCSTEGFVPTVTVKKADISRGTHGKS